MNAKIYTALGLMSGTSLDGVDAAIIRTDGDTIFGFERLEADERVVLQPSIYEASYSVLDRAEIKCAIDAALEWRFIGPPPNLIYRAEQIVDRYHARAVDALYSRFNPEKDDYEPCIDLIGYHGQTLVHLPPSKHQSGRTLQIGSGQSLANEFQIPCVYDFRTADVEAGGQGAPLAPIYHKALCEYSDLKGNVVVLNLGGVGNFTWVGDGPLMASDTGPANGPLDSWLEQHGRPYDADGEISERGNIDFAMVDSWLSADFFKKAVPKSADRYDFDVIPYLEGVSLEDGAATLAAYCALSVKKTIGQLDGVLDQIIVCGGGRKNQTIMNMLRAEMSCPVKTAEDVGWQGDFIEAQAFAYLAVRSKLGLPISFPETTGAPEPMTGGRIVYPK